MGHDEGLLQSEYDKYVKEYGAYEIIIPSVEQTKCYCGHTIYCDCSPLTETFQETLDVADQRIFSDFGDIIRPSAIKLAVMPVKWQEQRMYSEEEVIKKIIDYVDFQFNTNGELNSEIKKWFEQFKKN